MQTVHKRLSPAISPKASPKVSPGPTARRAIPTSKSWDSAGQRPISGSRSWDQLESARHHDVFGALGAKAKLKEGAVDESGRAEGSAVAQTTAT